MIQIFVERKFGSDIYKTVSNDNETCLCGKAVTPFEINYKWGIKRGVECKLCRWSYESGTLYTAVSHVNFINRVAAETARAAQRGRDDSRDSIADIAIDILSRIPEPQD
jgi:hypothetical protein